MLTCEQIQAALSAQLDGEDPGLDQDVLEAHVAGCAQCQAFYSQAALFNRKLHMQSEPPVAPDLSATILEEVDATWRKQIRLRNTYSWLCRLGLSFLGIVWGLWAIRLIGTAGISESRELYIDAAAIRLAVAAMLFFVAIFPRFAGSLAPFLGAWWSFSFGVRLQDIFTGSLDSTGVLLLVLLLGSVILCALTWLVQVGVGVIRETLDQLRS